jgi:nucleotide-binding universal stress UspA family protein
LGKKNLIVFADLSNYSRFPRFPNLILSSTSPSVNYATHLKSYVIPFTIKARNLGFSKIRIMTKILIALDYDPTAQKVAEAGYAYAKSLGAEVTLLHVINEPVLYYSKEYSPIMGFSGYLEAGKYELDSIEGIKDASHFYLDMVKRHLGDETIKTLVIEGDFSDEILKAAKKLKVDVIVLGSHSKKWLENIVMGSVTEKVLHHTSIPLLIVPTKKRQS